MNSGTYPKIAIHDKEGYNFVYSHEIMYCISEGSHTHLHLTENRHNVVSKRLKEVGELLEDDAFVRIHHSHIINLAYAERYFNSKHNYVLMKDGAKLNVSRNRKSEFMDKFTRL